MLTAFQSQGHAQSICNMLAEQAQYVEPQEDRTFHCNRSTLDIGVLGLSVYFNIRNTPPKSGTFLLVHPVYVIGSYFE